MKDEHFKVCYFLSTTDVAGGANRSFLDLISHLLKCHFSNLDYVVIIRGHGPIEKELNAMGIKYYLVNYAESIKGVNIYRTLRRIVKNTLACGTVCRILRREKINLLHNNSLPTTIGMEASLICRIPYICHVRENIWSGLGMYFYFPGMVKKLMNHANALIYISNFTKKSYAGFAENSNTFILNDGIALENYKLPERTLFSESTVALSILGGINPQKGQMEAVKAFEILKKRGWHNIQLNIVGNGGKWKGSSEYYDTLKDYVKRNKLNEVHFSNVIEDLAELRKFRQHIDISLICSSAEGLGRTTIESLISGSLVIAANAGASSEIIEDGVSGLLYQPGNPEDLANKIEWAINNKAYSCKIAKAGQQYAIGHFNVEDYAPTIVKIYADILKAQRKN